MLATTALSLLATTTAAAADASLAAAKQGPAMVKDITALHEEWKKSNTILDQTFSAQLAMIRYPSDIWALQLGQQTSQLGMEKTLLQLGEPLSPMAAAAWTPDGVRLMAQEWRQAEPGLRSAVPRMMGILMQSAKHEIGMADLGDRLQAPAKNKFDVLQLQIKMMARCNQAETMEALERAQGDQGAAAMARVAANIRQRLGKMTSMLNGLSQIANEESEAGARIEAWVWQPRTAADKEATFERLMENPDDLYNLMRLIENKPEGHVQELRALVEKYQ